MRDRDFVRWILRSMGPEAMPKFLIVMWYICPVKVLRGTRRVP